ncbi:MAG TPA: tetratricopeptide repeat protein [Caulobacteraceae bacterium]|nr:tetratricopeptide repeat protein [Caulobacteraceae bacterium]
MPARSSAKSSASAAALGFAPVVQPTAQPTGEIAGDAASAGALARLDNAISQLKALSIVPMLQRALADLRDEKPKTASEWALKALNQDPRSGMAWYVLAVAREKAGDFANSLKAYRSALALLPDQSQVANDLGRLAYRMGMKDVAEQLFRQYLEARPNAHEAANNLACTLRDLGRSGEAIEILRRTIEARPDDAMIWNTLGTILYNEGDLENASTFFDESLRLDPTFFKARYNRGNARLGAGDLEGALADSEAALAQVITPDDRAMMLLARSNIKLAMGRIAEGWDDYESRLDLALGESTQFLVPYPRWTPETPLEGKRLLLMAEQGLGDEVLFANMIPEILEALGPEGKLMLAVEPRLVSLFQRSFPSAEVARHATYLVGWRKVRGAAAFEDRDDIDVWAPIASPLRRFRTRLEDFPAREAFLAADPARVRHWRAELEKAPPGRKVGVLWKSMKLENARQRFYSPFHLWAPVLKTPGVSFVNIQYGDCTREIEWAANELGVPFWSPPGIDLKDDLDDLSALTQALDLTIGFANATSNLAAAVGARTWMISTPAAWTRLGTDRMPWYPSMRVFVPSAFGRWEETMACVAESLAAF